MAEKFADLTNRIGINARVQSEKVQGPPPTASKAKSEPPSGHTDSTFRFDVSHVTHTEPFKVRSQSDENDQVKTDREFNISHVTHTQNFQMRSQTDENDQVKTDREFNISHVTHTQNFQMRSQTDESTQLVSSSRSFTVTQT